MLCCQIRYSQPATPQSAASEEPLPELVADEFAASLARGELREVPGSIISALFPMPLELQVRQRVLYELQGGDESCFTGKTWVLLVGLPNWGENLLVCMFVCLLS